jgi:DNA transformation protein and related proteins
MAYDAGLVEWAAEAMAPGHVTHRAMMGGATLYLDSTVFAIVDGDASLWFKGDAQSDAAWDEAGCARFTYTRGDGGVASMNYRAAPSDCYDDADALRAWAARGDGTVASMNYRRAPDEVLDDADAFRRWAGLALEAGGRAPVRKKRKA